MNSNGPATPPHDPPEHAMLAAEYALGVLDAQARREAERRIAEDPAFAAEVAAWEARLATMLDEAEPVAPPERVWPRIRATLGHDANEKKSAPRASLWQSLPFWRLAGATGFAFAAAAMVYIAVQRPPETVSGAPYVAAIRRDDGSAAYSATLDMQRGMMVVMPLGDGSVDASRVPELWLIPADGKPRSLGVIKRDGAMTMHLPAPLRDMADGAMLAVSMEPPGGSPTGSPTGPVMAQGRIVRI
ncbi:hypothetical protein FCE95_04030 [Luteimonas gilva]|uniref:Regulator of SigK n=1 Tax=Luteimonas gilva TaxID=2572684 RepID=A0A4U5JV83_9GAMM|nr:anti-sigma factor [Luteimonas gilva]TKR33475.1 hypothetical protein FCE95_04030 [Luteimonas gilva]